MYISRQKRRGIPDLFAYEEDDDLFAKQPRVRGKKGGNMTVHKKNQLRKAPKTTPH